VNTADGSEPRSGASRLGEPGSFEPGVDHLIAALTTRPHPHERTGRDAALAAFREASRSPARSARRWPPALPARLRRSAGPRRPVRILLPVRLAVAAASVIAVLAGLTAAAAAQALPAPVQQIAYHVLAPLGVVTQPKTPHPGAHSTVPHGRPSPSAAVTVPGSSSPAASGPEASATPTPTGSHPARKVTTTTVTRPVLRLVALKVNDRLVVVAPSDKAGQTVHLTELVGGTWTAVAAKPLGPKLRAFFLLPKTVAAGHLFRAEIPQAKKKVASASNRLWIPRLPKTGAKGVKPSPNPTTTATTTPDATATPIVTAIPSPSITSLPLQPPPTTSPAPAGSPTPSESPSPAGSPSPSESATPTPSRSQTPWPGPTVSGTSVASPPPPPTI
jgi:hypothetical protein